MHETNLILEGPDGAGKSTLAATITGGKDHLVWHHSYYPDKKDMFWQTAGSILSPVRVIDRMYHSELVYSPLYHGVPQRYGPRTRLLDRLIWTTCRVIIHCLPSYETCHQAWASGREELVKDEETFEQIYAAYRALQFTTPHISYDWTRDDLNDLAMLVAKAEVLMYPNKGPGIGHFRPGNVLLVGEQSNTPGLGLDLPFVHWDGCSPWLAEQLTHGGIDEQDLYWVNSKNLQGDLLCPDFLEDLSPVVVVALGEDAARWCDLTGIPHVQVPHPQYWKRFRAPDPYPLITLLQEHLRGH